MKSIAMFGVCVAMCAAVSAQEAGAPSAADVAQQKAVEELLLEDDGVAIVTAPDGGFQIFTRGTGEYDFNDPRDQSDARKVARANAEANLAKFIKTSVVSEDTVDTVSAKSVAMTGDGKVQNKRISKDTLQTIKNTIKTTSEAILGGLVVVESKKVPNPGTTGGSIQITMVYSSKTGAASVKLGKAMQDNQAELQMNDAKNAARVQAARMGDAASQASAGCGVGANAPACGAAAAPQDDSAVRNNKPEHRVNKTEF